MSLRFFICAVIICISGISTTIYLDIANSSVNTSTVTTASVQKTTTQASLLSTAIASSTTRTTAANSDDVQAAEIPEQNFTYLEINNSCSIVLSEDCLTAHSQPSSTSTVRQQLRNGMVLLVDETITTPDGSSWHRIAFDEQLRYRERLQLPWYVSADAGEIFTDVGVQHLTADTPTTTKHILIERGTQMLYVYDGDELFMATSTATGLWATPTPRGHFTVFTKTPTRYMQGPIPDITPQYYDLPGVPWNLYFTHQGAIVHGVYWHDTFGAPYSNGCVNLPTHLARELYEWADVGMSLVVRD